MDMGKAMIVAGVGCRRDAPAADIEAAIAAACSRAGVATDALGLIATAAFKSGERGIEGAASKLGIAIVLVPQDELGAASQRAMTHSARVAARVGVPSVAEAAALAAAGPAARLLGRHIIIGAATCALAETGVTT
jgi:cobalt-precorrin 5A hydrolase